jgi:hypothetical protein
LKFSVLFVLQQDLESKMISTAIQIKLKHADLDLEPYLIIAKSINQFSSEERPIFISPSDR